ncbi:MAG: hypothetical protein JWM35_1501 [Verrucomicrobia bacterium]|nr:hypothetical protein [Verrucomicrobiota bacterium]
MSDARQREKAVPATAVPANLIGEVRYSLPEMLAEIKIERAAAAFAMEKLDQSEIKKLFKTPGRVNPKK